MLVGELLLFALNFFSAFSFFLIAARAFLSFQALPELALMAAHVKPRLHACIGAVRTPRNSGRYGTLPTVKIRKPRLLQLFTSRAATRPFAVPR